MHVYVHRRWRGWVRRVGWACVGVAVLALGGWVVVQALQADRTGDGAGFQRWTNWANVLALLIGALGTAVVILDKILAVRAAPPGPVDGEQLGHVAAALARQLERDWSRQAALREATRPAPVLVSWSSSGRRAADRPVVLNEAGTDWQQLPLRGRLDELNQAIVAAFRELPHRQLMVLGEPGAGKSVFAMLLTLGLIRHPAADEPVPVLLPINVWDPREPVETFVARRLAEDYAQVLARHGDPTLLARLLVAERRILPILDGLDELPDDAQGEATTVLDAYAAQGRPLVVTSRLREYEQAVARGRVLSRTAVIELEPVTVEAAIAYLSQPVADPRWEPVFADLRGHPHGPLAKALSTPLMVAMARTAYLDPRTTPGDLLDLTTTPQITGRLMDAFLTAAYTHPPRRPNGRTVRTYPPERAVRWVGTLAYHLYLAGTRDLHWWQIAPDLLSVRPGWAVTMTVATAVVLAAAGGGLVGAVTGTGWTAAAAAVAAAAVMVTGAAGWLQPLWPPGYPPYVVLSYRTPTQRRRLRWALGLGYGIGAGLLTGLVTSAWVACLTGGGICGLLTVLVPSWRPSPRSRHATPTASLRRNHRLAAAAAVQNAALGGLAFAVTGRLAHTGPGPTVTAAIVCAATASLTTGGWTWIRFRLTHARLTRTHHLPPRLWAFLDDAHHRGVLRRAGTVYQFRHALLQDHLAPTIHIQHLQARADAGDRDAAWRLVDLLAEQGCTDEAITLLRAWTDAGDRDAAGRLANLLAQRGRTDEAITLLRAWTDAGDWHAERRLVDLLAQQGRTDELRARANAGDRDAAERLVDLLAQQGRTDEAITLLQGRANDGDQYAERQLAHLLAQQGRTDEAITLLQGRADAGDWHAERRLEDLLAQQGRTDEAITLLRTRADAGDWHAAWWLADLLAQQGRTDEAITLLQGRADAGDQYAKRQLAHLLAQQGRTDEAITLLRTRADAGDQDAAWWLVDLLAQQGRTDELRARANAGHEWAAERLADLLAQQGRTDELRARADAGDQDAAERLADLLAQQGRTDELRARANAGHGYAAERLADLLAQQGRTDEAITLLRTRADAGDRDAAERLADLLAQQGRTDELRARANAGDWYAAIWLADLLASRKTDMENR